MQKEQKLVKAVTILFLVSSVGCTLTYGSYSNYCSSSGQVEFVVTERTSGSQISYNWVSNYLNADSQSAPIYVKKNANEVFKFATVSSAGVLQADSQCTGTQAYEYHGLIKEYLFLKTGTGAGTTYYVCRYMNSGNPIVLAMPYDGTLVSFVPWMVMEPSSGSPVIWVWRIQALAVRRIQYTWPTGLQTQLNRAQDSFTYSQTLTSAVGTGMHLYDHINNKFVRINTSGDGWEDVPSAQITFTGTPTVLSFPLTRNYVGLTLTSSSSLTGDAYIMASDSPSSFEKLAVSSTTSTFALKYFSDGIYNFARLTSNELYWVTVQSSANSYFKTSITNIQNTRLSNIQHIAFSKNRAMILYTDGSLQVYIHKLTNSVDSTVSNKPTNSIDVSATKQYTIALNCFCGRIRSVICYSQTLECIVINKASTATNCKGSGDTITSW